jgi:benzoate membrane transport protein
MTAPALSERPDRLGLLQPISAGLVGAITGFASSFVLLLSGLRAVGASPEEAASGLLVLCLGQGVVAIVLSLRFRLPISIAWSTPGAAVLLAAHQTTHDFRAAVGAFLLCGVLLVLTGLWPWLARAMTSIPKPIASAMLAGILFPICLAPAQAAVQLPALALPAIAVWVVLWRVAPRWAVPGAVVATAIAVLIAAGPDWAAGAQLAPAVVPVLPRLDPLVLVGLGIPLYIVTMAGQNVPGFAVLTTLGYADPPARTILTATGLATTATSFFGGYALNLSAITAAMVAGPDAHPDPRRRWIASVTSGSAYLVIGPAAGVAGALVAASPSILITAVAGLALLGALVSSIATALEAPEHRIVAIATFLVVASGISVAGIGSAFWGLAAGGLLMIVFTLGRRRRTA